MARGTSGDQSRDHGCDRDIAAEARAALTVERGREANERDAFAIDVAHYALPRDQATRDRLQAWELRAAARDLALHVLHRRRDADVAFEQLQIALEIERSAAAWVRQGLKDALDHAADERSEALQQRRANLRDRAAAADDRSASSRDRRLNAADRGQVPDVYRRDLSR